tara:strand:+ start:559 stop:1392 length:834 start_codon:yes stop_codon:yes gene_type:complete
MFKEAFKYANENFKHKFTSFFLILLPVALVSSLIGSFNLPDTAGVDFTQPTPTSPGNELGKYPILGILNQLVLQGLVSVYITIKVINDNESIGTLKSISDYYYGSILFIFRLFLLGLCLVLAVLVAAVPGGIILIIGQALNIELITSIGAIIGLIGILFIGLKTTFSYFYLICENKSLSESILASFYSVPNKKVINLLGTFVLLILLVVIVSILISMILGLALTPFMGISMDAYIFALTFIMTLLSITMLNIYMFLFFYRLYAYFKGDSDLSLNADL